jgi:arsenate reductase-like glutaredoxin family protein
MIKLFGNPWCPPCKKAKEVIQSTDPSGKGVKFEYKDVSDDPSFKPLPLIIVGEERLEGFNETELREALDRLYSQVEDDDSEEPAYFEDRHLKQPPDTAGKMATYVAFGILGFLLIGMAMSD